MNIQAGKYYITRNGELVGPMEVSSEGNVEIGSPWYVQGLGLYRYDGIFGYGEKYYVHSYDITQTVDDAARCCVEGENQ